jgi:gamma-butyrobetaine dioxygenase
VSTITPGTLRHDRLVDALFAVLAEGTPGLLDHLLGAAAAAERDQAPPELVAAALLHDIGHLLADAKSTERHEEVGGAFLQGWFPAGVVQPVRLHVAAKRYLCTISPSYLDRLSAGSRRRFDGQGGPMSRYELEVFESSPHAAASCRLRRYDDQPGGPRASGLEHYRPVLRSVAR